MCAAPPGKTLCHRCHQIVIGDYFNVNAQYYHKMCFKCEKCWTPLTKGYYPLDGKTVCENCYRAQKGLGSRPTCQSCQQPIVTGKCMKLGDLAWHGDCFKCQGCNKMIQGNDFVIDVNMIQCPDCNVKRKLAALGIK